MEQVYDNPKYYDIAFSFRNIEKEVDVFEKCFKLYCKIPVRSIIELGCGNSPHMNELLSRGYNYIGLDLNDQMLSFSKNKAIDIQRAKFVKADMINFSIKDTVQFAFIMLGSLYAKSTSDIQKHFDSVARIVEPGGLYLLDWCIHFTPLTNYQEGWETKRNGIKIKTTCDIHITNPIEQLIEEKLTMEVMDKGQYKKITEKSIKRVIYPQEFFLIVRHYTLFEFVGWWNKWDLAKPLEGLKGGKINRPIILLRRK